ISGGMYCRRSKTRDDTSEINTNRPDITQFRAVTGAMANSHTAAARQAAVAAADGRLVLAYAMNTINARAGPKKNIIAGRVIEDTPAQNAVRARSLRAPVSIHRENGSSVSVTVRMYRFSVSSVTV